MASGGEESLYGEELKAGALVGRWVVERVHYRGPVSTLYLARDVYHRETAALKVMHAQAAAGETALRRFRREAATLQRLRHPNIVGVLGYGELADGRPYIAMEWLEGRDLAAELAARGPLSPGEALEVVEQVGAALRAAHGVGVVHRDLKAQNVVRLVGGVEAHRVKLVDFGVAKGLTPDAPGASSLTHTGVALGTPLSMAPEQIRGEAPDARTDLYALGVLLFQLVTGQPPFLGATRHEVEEQHLHAPPPRPGERAPVPAALDAVVLRCLRKPREERYPDVDALLEDLRRAVRGERAPAGVGLGVALYVEARLADGVSLERLDTVLERAGAAAREVGLEVRVEGSGCLLALAPLPEDAEGARAMRERVLGAALALAGEELAISLHVDRLPPEGGGGLLRLPDWVSEGPGVVVSGPVLSGLSEGFRVEPYAAEGRVRVTGRR
jgi:serine/threonine-protein kinase